VSDQGRPDIDDQTAETGAEDQDRKSPPVQAAAVGLVIAGGTAGLVIWLIRRATQRRSRWERARDTATDLAARTGDRLQVPELAALTSDLASRAGERLSAGEQVAAQAGEQLRDRAADLGQAVRSSDAAQAAADTATEQGRRLASSHRAQGAAAAVGAVLALSLIRRAASRER
jgi:hypothetical protein